MRDTYTKEKKKDKMPSGSGTDQDGDKWEFYEQMSFLNDFIKHRRSVLKHALELSYTLCNSYAFIYLYSTTSNALDVPPPGSEQGPESSHKEQGPESSHKEQELESSRNTLSRSASIQESEWSLPETSDEASSATSSDVTTPTLPQKRFVTPNITTVSAKKKGKGQDSTGLLEKEILSALSDLKAPPPPPADDDDEDAQFASIVKNTLKRFNPRLKAIARLQMQELLLNLEFPPGPPLPPLPINQLQDSDFN